MRKFEGKLKKLLTGVLAVAMLAGSTTMTADAKIEYPFRDHYEHINEMTEVCWNAYNKGEYGPIIVAQGVLTSKGTQKDIYLITLCGTELVEGQSTGIVEDILVGFQNADNDYTKNVIRVIKETIPENSNLMLLGHSLGGMVCQTVAADEYVKAHYNILNTVTLGSPVIKGGQREGVVKRLGDTSDFVPYLSVTGMVIRQIFGLNREDGGYSEGGWSIQKGWAAHNGSYIREDVWGDYDVTGVKGGNATLDIDTTSIRFEQAPSWRSLLQPYMN